MKRTIALVEDNADNRMLVRAFLDGEYEITEYEGGAEAVAGIIGSRPDLVLLDVSLPEMDGTEVLSRLRAEPALAGLPVVALTAHAMTGDREKYLSMGFDDYVTKPIVDETILLGAITRHIGA